MGESDGELRIGILEDNPDDADLLAEALRRSGIGATCWRAATEAEYLARLDPPPDLILADFALPGFDAFRALALLRERDPDVPLIVVTGAVGEEVAVACVQQGAADYLLKDRLGRLGAAVRRALAEGQARRERRQAEAALRASERRFRALVQNAADAIAVLAPDGAITYQSPSVAALLGTSAAMLAGTSLFAHLHPDDRAPVRAALGRLLADPGGTVTATYRLRRADGSWVTVESVGQNRLADPAVGGVVLNTRDVTERRRAEEERERLLGAEQQARVAAEAAQQRLELLAEAGTLLDSALDLADTLQRAVRLVVPRLADWSTVDLLGEDGRVERVAAAHVDPAREALLREVTERYPIRLDQPRGAAAVLRTGRALLEAELSEADWEAVAPEPGHRALLRALGPRSAVLVPLTARGRRLGVLSLSHGPSGRRYAPGDLALAADLASRAALAIDNARLYRDAQAALRLRTEFLSIAAHELKTPITGLRMAVQALLRYSARGVPADAPPLRDALQTTDTQSTKLTRMVVQLLEVSRLQLGRLELQRGPENLADLVAGVVRQIQAQTTRHALALSAPAEVWATVDAMRFEQVVTNLLDNAVKYSPNGGRIDVALASIGPEWIGLTVRDRGLGIPPERRSQIFDLFYQAHLDSHRSGMGIGLYLVRQIVEGHGGHVDVAFPPDGGSCFRIELPTGPAAAAERNQRAESG